MICTWYIGAFCSWNGKPLFRSSFLHLALECFSKVAETIFVRHYISFSFPPMNIGCVNHICVFAFFAPAPSPLLSASHWKWLMAFRPHSECTNPWIECRCQIPLAWLPTNKQSNQNQVTITRFEAWSRSDLKENVPPELCLQQGVISSPGWTISRKVCRPVPLKAGAASCLLGGGPCAIQPSTATTRKPGVVRTLVDQTPGPCPTIQIRTKTNRNANTNTKTGTKMNTKTKVRLEHS